MHLAKRQTVLMLLTGLPGDQHRGAPSGDASPLPKAVTQINPDV
jgi:hypothetical protein